MPPGAGGNTTKMEGRRKRRRMGALQYRIWTDDVGKVAIIIRMSYVRASECGAKHRPNFDVTRNWVSHCFITDSVSVCFKTLDILYIGRYDITCWGDVYGTTPWWVDKEIPQTSSSLVSYVCRRTWSSPRTP